MSVLLKAGEKPANYPLPWCEPLGLAYWQINLVLCFCMDGWRTKQSGVPMSEVIPGIDDLIAQGVLLASVERAGA